MKLREIILRAQYKLQQSGVEEASFTALFLVRSFFGFDAATLYIYLDEEFAIDKFWSWVERCADGEPPAYIVGKQEFFGRTFLVNKDVLIPRPETEILIESVLSRYSHKECLTVFDVGTGSGNIAITLKKELKDAIVYSLDISQAALNVAKMNASTLQANIDFIKSDLLAMAPKDGAHIIAANLPYVACGQAQTDGFEPHLALYCGENPLFLIKRLINECPPHLKSGGSVFLEVGEGQAEEVLLALKDTLHNCTNSGIEDDLAGIGRIVWASIS